MDYLTIIFMAWCITTFGGLTMFLLPTLWRKYITRHVAMDDHFGFPFFLLSAIPVISAIIYLIYAFYLIPLSWFTKIRAKIDAKNKQPINCPTCGTEHIASEYKGESFHTSQLCKHCGLFMTVSKTDVKGVYTTEPSRN